MTRILLLAPLAALPACSEFEALARGPVADAAYTACLTADAPAELVEIADRLNLSDEQRADLRAAACTVILEAAASE